MNLDGEQDQSRMSEEISSDRTVTIMISKTLLHIAGCDRSTNLGEVSGASYSFDDRRVTSNIDPKGLQETFQTATRSRRVACSKKMADLICRTCSRVSANGVSRVAPAEFMNR